MVNTKRIFWRKSGFEKKVLLTCIFVLSLFLLVSCSPSPASVTSQADEYIYTQSYDDAIRICTDFLNKRNNIEVQEKLEQAKQEMEAYNLILKTNKVVKNINDNLSNCKSAKDLRDLIDTSQEVICEIDKFQTDYTNAYSTYINAVKNDGFYKTYKDEYLSHNMISFDENPYQSTLTDLTTMQIKVLIEGSFLFYDNPVSELDNQNASDLSIPEKNTLKINIPETFEKLIIEATEKSDAVVCRDLSNAGYGSIRGIKTIDVYENTINSNGNECYISSSLYYSLDKDKFDYEISLFYTSDERFDLHKVYISNEEDTIEFPAKYFDVNSEIKFYGIIVSELKGDFPEFNEFHKMLLVGDPIIISFEGIEQKIEVELSEKQMESFIIISTIYQELSAMYELNSLSF